MKRQPDLLSFVCVTESGEKGKMIFETRGADLGADYFFLANAATCFNHILRCMASLFKDIAVLDWVQVVRQLLCAQIGAG
ncbi:hypothetical protein [Chitinimonas taiwanensis]|uniref:hypothetical protein n=1 Tax=Chitinimonas taiwanensis TaxID=240412 RepID=UPI001114BBDC|nr:hypothetical protein [Chitinimonas taiwanensis]